MKQDYFQPPRPDVDFVRSRLLEEIKRLGLVQFNQLMRWLPVNDRTLEAGLLQLMSDGSVVASSKGYKAKNAQDSNLLVSRECDTCAGRGVATCDEAKEIYSEYISICKSAPMYSYSLNQRPVTLDTAWHRALFALRPGVSSLPRVVTLIGDDDLTSLALALQAPEIKVQVLEADERLVSFINYCAQERNLNCLTATVYNARDPIPDGLIGKSDLAICDPSSSLFDLFLSRCIDLCRRDGQGQIMTFAYPTYLGRDLSLQQKVTQMGLMIDALLPGFNRYHLHDIDISDSRPVVPRNGKEETVAFVEALMQLRVTDEAKPLVDGVCTLSDEELYGEKAAQRILDQNNDPAEHQNVRKVSSTARS